MVPTSLSPPADAPIPRAITAFHLERKLAAFILQLFTNTYALDNPAVNLLQPAEPEMHDLDQPPPSPEPFTMDVGYDYTERAQTLLGKVPPRVVTGRVPRTVTGELDPSQLPDYPSIVVQAIDGKVMTQSTHVTVRIFIHAYDENPDSQGYQDLTNMIETLAGYLTSWGQQAIDEAFPIILPIEWKIPDSNIFPHFIAEMTTTWELPSARPLPDPDNCITPMEAATIEVTPWSAS